MTFTDTAAMTPAQWTTHAMATMDRLMGRVVEALRYAAETDRILAGFPR